MKAQNLIYMATMAMFVILAALAKPIGLSAQQHATRREPIPSAAPGTEDQTFDDNHDETDTQHGLKPEKKNARHSHYAVIDLGTLGGPHSQFNFGSRILNHKGSAVGGASTKIPDPVCLFDFPFCFVFHAFKYENNVLTDLGSLPGGVNSLSVAVNSSGVVAGISENGLIDSVTGLSAGVATVWKNDRIFDLGTLGGSFSLASDINNREEAVGGAENTIPDPDNLGGLLIGLPSPTQWHAVLWRDRRIVDLGTLGTGPDSFAGLVNNRGQVAGFSYTNSIVNPETGIPTVDPFFWEDGQMIDVGTLGGVYGTLSGMNNKGQVAGTSDLAGDQAAHPFLWERGSLRDLGTFGGTLGAANWIDDSGGVVGGATTENNQLFRAFRWINGHMTNLGSLNGDQCSIAFGGNLKGQVVGNSLSDCDHETHAFLWENGGPMVDLNSFVLPGSGILLREGVFINERGEIAVSGRVANGDDHAFLLVPVDELDENLADAAQAGPELNQPSPAVIHTAVTPKDVVAFAARSTRRYRGFRPKQAPVN